MVFILIFDFVDNLKYKILLFNLKKNHFFHRFSRKNIAY